MKLLLIFPDHAAESGAEKTVNLKLIGKRFFSAETVRFPEGGHEAGISFLRIYGNSGQFRRIQIRSYNRKIKITSRRTVKEGWMNNNRNDFGSISCGGHHMRRTGIYNKTAAGIRPEGAPADLVQNPALGNKGNFQFTVPVAADIAVLKIVNIVVIDLKGKIRSAVGT